MVSDLELAHPPPVATVPLGTGNNLPFSFGWVGGQQLSSKIYFSYVFVSLMFHTKGERETIHIFFTSMMKGSRKKKGDSLC